MEKHPLEDLSEIYLSEQSISKSTIKSYRICFKYFFLYLKKNEILIAKTSDVIKFRESLRNQGYSTYYIYIYMSTLRGFYRYLRMNQLRFNLDPSYLYDIMTMIKNEKIKPRVKKPLLSLDEAKHVITHMQITRQKIYDYRNYAIICLMLTAGLSPYEIIHLKLEDYQVIDEKAVLIIKKGRSQKEFIIYLSKGCIRALDDYLSKRKKKDNPYLFISQNQTTKEGHLSRTFFYAQFGKIMGKCGLENRGITAHSLRHTSAYLNLLRGDTIESTKKLLRHESILSTLVYQAYIDQMKDTTEEKIEAFILNEEVNNFLEDSFYTDFFIT